MNIQDIQYLRQETGAGIMDCKNALNEASGDVQQSLAILQAKGFQVAQKKADRAVLEGIAYAETFENLAVLLEVNTETDFVAGNDQFIAGVKKIAQTIAQQQPDDIYSLLASPIEGQDLSVNELVQKMVLTFRENIVIRRFDIINGVLPIAYMHQKGKYGVILNLATDGEFDSTRLNLLGKELAMQIAAMAPQFVSRFHLSDAAMAEIKAQIVQEVTADDNLSRKAQSIIDKIIAGRIEKFYRSHCLLEQAFVRDDSITVKQFIQTATAGSDVQIEVTGLFRYERAEGLRGAGASNVELARQMAKKR